MDLDCVPVHKHANMRLPLMSIYSEFLVSDLIPDSYTGLSPDSGAPTLRARGTEPHTHGIWSTSFCLVVTRPSVRTRLQIVRVG